MDDRQDDMDIEFHCEHCGKVVTAPEDAAGRRGKCPHCDRKVYIPYPSDEAQGELRLAPLDPEDERRRLKAHAEAVELQYRLLHEQAAPGERRPRRNRFDGNAAAAPAAKMSRKELNRLLVEFVEAMGGGRLERADQAVGKMAKHKSQVLDILDGLATDELAAYGLPALPRPVLLGFLKQLRLRLQGGLR